MSNSNQTYEFSEIETDKKISLSLSLSLELFSNATRNSLPTRDFLIVEKGSRRSNKTGASATAGFDRCRRFVSVNEREAEGRRRFGEAAAAASLRGF